jgi:Kelch motif
MNDTWEWNGTSWSLRASTGPPPRYDASMVYDAQQGAIMLFGGWNGNAFGDLWKWNGTAWTQLSVPGPAPRTEAPMVYDSQRGVAVLFGGNGVSSTYADTWELQPPCTGPSIDMPPTPQSVCGSSSAPFSIAASGATVLGYDWQVQSPAGVWLGLTQTPAPLGCGGFISAPTVGGPSISIDIIPCTGVNAYPVRCVVFNACATVISTSTLLTINSADFNGDGDVGTDADIESFFACLSGNCCTTCGTADFNSDGDTGTDADIESFFSVLGGGPC